eukprot:685958-Pelagomonas_calceolata.AAC.1
MDRKQLKNAHTMLHVHWDSKPCLAFRWKETHVSSFIGTLASLDDINYRIPLDNSQVKIRKLEAHNLEA